MIFGFVDGGCLIFGFGGEFDFGVGSEGALKINFFVFEFVGIFGRDEALEVGSIKIEFNFFVLFFIEFRLGLPFGGTSLVLLHH